MKKIKLNFWLFNTWLWYSIFLPAAFSLFIADNIAEYILISFFIVLCLVLFLFMKEPKEKEQPIFIMTD